MLKHLTILNHPGFTVFLLVCSCVFGVVWYTVERALTPPSIVGWDWSKHPKTFVVWYAGSKGCTCATDLNSSVNKVTSNQGEVVIVAEQATIEQSELGNNAQGDGVYVFPKESLPIAFWRNPSKTEALFVRDGRITHRMIGLLIPDSFLHE